MPVLNWLGPWSFTTFLGLGEHQSPVSQTRYWGGRFNFRPTASLELGVSRVSQWGGQGKNNGFGDWWDMVINKDEASANSDQRAAIDASYHFNLLNQPLTAYVELADDDMRQRLARQSFITGRDTQLLGQRLKHSYRQYGVLRHLY